MRAAEKRCSNRRGSRAAIERGRAADRRDAPRRRSTMKPVTPSSITSGTEPQRQAITGVPQAMASIITRPNGSGQSIGNSSAAAPPRKSRFSRVADLADELDQRMVEQRLDLSSK